ncbi:MAG: hypothetical protein ABDH23_02870 [Endomicrobiia bacterium]
MCYLVPTAAAIVTTFVKKKNQSMKWLTLMFYGGAIFGIVDHWWNGELFLVSPDWLKDMLLGVVITAAILLVWAFIVLLAKKPTTVVEQK